MTLDILLKRQFEPNGTRTTCVRENDSEDDITCLEPVVEVWGKTREFELKKSVY